MSHTIESTGVAGLSLRALRGGDGRPVVVLHHSFGNPGWSRFHELLASHCGVRVPDLPGYGASERPEWARHPRDLAILLGLWLDALGGDAVTLVGAGLGGWVAAELATFRPQRLDGLVLVGAAGLLPREGRILDQFMLAHRDYVRDCFAHPDGFEAHFGDGEDVELLVQWDLNREMTSRIGWKPYMYNRALASLLPELRTRALVVWGDRDRVVPRECGEEYAKLIPSARFELVPDCGHAVDLERPDELAELVLRHLRAEA